MTTITLQKATLSQASEVHHILVENTVAYHKAKFNQDVLKGFVYAIETAHTIIGTITLLPNKPDTYPFGIWHTNKQAWYVQNFALKLPLLSLPTVQGVFSTVELLGQKEKRERLCMKLSSQTIRLLDCLEFCGFTQVSYGFLGDIQNVFIEKCI